MSVHRVSNHGTANTSLKRRERLENSTRIPTRSPSGKVEMRKVDLQLGDVGLGGVIKKKIRKLKSTKSKPIFDTKKAKEDIKAVREQKRQREAVGIARKKKDK